MDGAQKHKRQKNQTVVAMRSAAADDVPGEDGLSSSGAFPLEKAVPQLLVDTVNAHGVQTKMFNTVGRWMTSFLARYGAWPTELELTCYVLKLLASEYSSGSAVDRQIDRKSVV